MSVGAPRKQRGVFFTPLHVFDVRQARPKCAIALSVCLCSFSFHCWRAVLMSICVALVLRFDCPPL